MLIYTDKDQCELFSVLYYQPNEVLICSAEALLRSKKGDGYDEKHRKYLESFNTKTLVLERTEKCKPGEWEIIKTL